MPTETILAGEKERVYTGEPGDTVFIRSDERIRVHSDRHFVRNGRVIEPDMPGEIELRERGEEVWVYADGSDATVNYERQGFSLSLFGKEIFEVTNEVDTNISGQTSTLTADTARQSASGVTEVNADQTGPIDGAAMSNPTNPQSEVVTIQANPGELWRLRAVRIDIPVIDTTASFDHNVEIQTEVENVPFLDGTASADSTLIWEAGTWVQGTGRGDPEGALLDDTNGIEVEYFNGSDMTQDDGRTYRFQFEQLAV